MYLVHMQHSNVSPSLSDSSDVRRLHLWPHCSHLYNKKNIPVGCVPPTFLIPGEVSVKRPPPTSGQRPALDRDLLWRETPGQRPPDKDPRSETPAGQRLSWTETPWTETPGQRPPGQRPPGQRLPWTETPLDRDPSCHQ